MLQRKATCGEYCDRAGSCDASRGRYSEWAPTLTETYDPDQPTVCLCHAGMRSRQFANLLIDQGFSQVYNVSGGIEAYSCLVDASVPRY